MVLMMTFVVFLSFALAIAEQLQDLIFEENYNEDKTLIVS